MSSGLAIITINSTKKLRNFLKYGGGIFFMKWGGGRKGEENGKGVVLKFSFRIVCQNIIPFSLICHTENFYLQ